MYALSASESLTSNFSFHIMEWREMCVTTIIDLVINFLAFRTLLLGLNKNAVQFCFTKLQNLVPTDNVKIAVSKHCPLGSNAWSRL